MSSSAAVVAEWNFAGPNPLADLAGNFGALQLQGAAAVSGGKLIVAGPNGNAGGTPTAWAKTDRAAYAGPAILDRTLEVWLTVSDLAGRGGAALGLSFDPTPTAAT